MSDTELLPKSKPEPVRRLEVSTGSGRRRTGPLRKRRRSSQQLFGWRREAQRRAKRRAANDVGAASGPAFAPVVVEEVLPSLEAPVAPNEVVGNSIIEIVIGAAMVRVAPGIDAATLTAVLRAVKATT